MKTSQIEVRFLEKINPRKTVHRVLYGGVVFFFLIGLIIWNVISGLPDREEIKNYHILSTVKSFDNFNWDQTLEGPIRKWVPLSAISQNLQHAVIISEDDTFFEHSGINFRMMKEAFKVNLERKSYARGASTITMQLARNAFLTKDKSLVRKLKEMILARRIEKTLTKNRILELYLNIVEWGENIYGAEAAAQYYFGKPAHELDLAEATLLASILPNPKRFNPFKRMQTARKLQKRVLNLMMLSRLIDEQTVATISNTPIRLRGQSEPGIPGDSSQKWVKTQLDISSVQDSMGNRVLHFVNPAIESHKAAIDSFSNYTNSKDRFIADSTASDKL